MSNQTHLREIHQSGAAVGQFAKWDGTSWIPSTGSAASPYSEDTMGNADKTWGSGLSTMRITATFTADRTLTLPAANSLVAGSLIFLQDPDQFIQPTTGRLIIQRAGADTINNATSITFAPQLTATTIPRILIFTTDGISQWSSKGSREYTSFLNYSSRLYVTQTLAVNTNRMPSLTNDVLVIMTIELNTDDGETSTANVLVDDSGGLSFQTICTIENTFNVSGIGGITGTLVDKKVITFICPIGSNYKWTSSGTGTATLINIMELLM